MPGKSHVWRSLVGCSPWGHEESDTTERLHFRFSLSCIGEGNGNPLQCSCLERPIDSGAWWAALYGVAQSRTRLKRLSSSSSSSSEVLKHPQFPISSLKMPVLSSHFNLKQEAVNERIHKTWCMSVSEKEMAPHSSTLAWKTLWMEEPGGLLSMVSHRVGHD